MEPKLENAKSRALPDGKREEGAGRQEYLDVLRAAAAFAVVLLHASALPIHFERDLQSWNWWLGNLEHSATRWCVPVFVMISGVLLLNERKAGPVIDFYRKRLGRVGWPLLFWTALYSVLVYRSSGGSFETVGRRIMEGKPFFHLWYLYMIAAMYAALPFLRALFLSLSNADRWVLTAVILSAAFLDSTAARIMERPPATFLLTFVPFAGYLFLGPLLHSLLPRETATARCLWGFAGGTAVIAAGSYFAIERMGPERGGVFYGYFSPPVVLCAASVFLLGKELAKKPFVARWNPVVRSVSGASFGIYLLHPLLNLVIDRAVNLAAIPNVAAIVPFLAAAVFAVSYILTLLLFSIPGLRRIA